MGSNMLVRPARFRFALGAVPSPPTTAAPRSDRMSPKRLSGDDHVESLRLRHQVQSHRVGVRVVNLHLRIPPTDLLQDIHPDPASIQRMLVLWQRVR